MKHEKESAMQGAGGRRVPGRENSACKGPEMGPVPCLWVQRGHTDIVTFGIMPGSRDRANDFPASPARHGGADTAATADSEGPPGRTGLPEAWI